MRFLTFCFILGQHIFSQYFWTSFEKPACCFIVGWLVKVKSPPRKCHSQTPKPSLQIFPCSVKEFKY